MMLCEINTRKTSFIETSVSIFRREYVVVTFLALNILIGNSIVLGVKAGTPLNMQELKNVAVEVKEAEERISNIKIESEVLLDESNSFYGPWERKPTRWLLSAWFTGDWDPFEYTKTEQKRKKNPMGKARIDICEIGISEDGKSIEERCSIGFDGTEARYVRDSYIYKGETKVYQKGIRDTDASKILVDTRRAFTGLAYTLQYSDEVFPLSRAFELASDPNLNTSNPAFQIEFSWEEFLDVMCIRLNTPTNNLVTWFDPEHGYALRGSKEIYFNENGDEEPFSFWKVTKLIQADGNVWWPEEVVFVTKIVPNEEIALYYRYLYRVLNVVANDPNFDESVFTIPFPDGYTIDDKVEGKTYIVGEK